MITIVTGLPRTGTSMTMQMLVAGGLPALVDANHNKADDLNPHGYVEYEAVKELKDKPELILGAEGKCLKIISEWIFGLPAHCYDKDQMGQWPEYKVLMTARNLDEVMDSQWIWIQRRWRWYLHLWAAAADREKVKLQYKVHIDHVTFFLACRHIPTYIVNYRDAHTNPLALAQEIDAFLGLGLNTTAMANAVDKNLWRNRRV